MTEQEKKAMARVAKKLSELRKSLRKDERAILDRLVTGSSSDVEGHSLDTSQDFIIYSADAQAYQVQEGATP